MAHENVRVEGWGRGEGSVMCCDVVAIIDWVLVTKPVSLKILIRDTCGGKIQDVFFSQGFDRSSIIVRVILVNVTKDSPKVTDVVTKIF